MAEPTLVQLFGTNAFQDLNSLVLIKSDLAGVGLTPSATNTAESLLAAIIAFAEQTLTDTNQDTNPEQSISISNNSDSLISRNGFTFRRKSKTIEFDKADNNSTFDPDDY